MYAFLIAVKYAVIHADIAINGSPIAIKNKTLVETILCKQILTILLENNIKSRPAFKPSKRLKRIQLRIALIAILSFCNTNFSGTITVAATLKPEVATVIKNR
ncbi:unknown [Clostridium sp. CAG:575]|nr:unknown [Clostridium sp. CAG:575]